MGKKVALNKVDHLVDLTMYLQRHFLINLSAQTSEMKLSISQYMLLSFLSVENHLTMGHLAALMGHSTPAATGLVDRLCKVNLVRRKLSAQDRRQVHVEITAKGRKVVNETRKQITGCIQEITSRLSESDRDAWVRVYQSMHDYIEDKRNTHSC